jgi:hypothetical protein
MTTNRVIAADCFQLPANWAEKCGCSRPTPSRSLTKNLQTLAALSDSSPATNRTFVARNGRSHCSEPLRAACWAGRNCIPSSPRPVHSCSAHASSKKTGACSLARTASIASRCRKRRLSRDAPFNRSRFQSRIPATEATPQPPDLPIGLMASQPFRRDTCARHHP